MANASRGSDDTATVTVPCGITTEGLPVGLQIAGRDVATVLGVAATYQALTQHHLVEPAPLTAVVNI